MAKLRYLLNVQRSDGNYIPHHYHPCYEIVFYSSGSGETNCFLGDVAKESSNFFEFATLEEKKEMQKFNFKKGNLMFYPPYVYHDELHIQGGRVLAFGFDTETPIPVMNYKYNELSSECLKCIQMIAGEYAVRKERFMDAIDALLELLIIEIGRLEDKKNDSPKDLEVAKNYIDNYYMTNIKIGELAKSCFYTTDHFIRVFQKKYGIHPKQYVLQLRLEEGLKMLRNTKLSVGEIGARVGYHTNADFSAFIKKCTGKSPMQIRRESVQGIENDTEEMESGIEVEN